MQGHSLRRRLLTSRRIAMPHVGLQMYLHLAITVSSSRRPPIVGQFDTLLFAVFKAQVAATSLCALQAFTIWGSCTSGPSSFANALEALVATVRWPNLTLAVSRLAFPSPMRVSTLQSLNR